MTGQALVMASIGIALMWTLQAAGLWWRAKSAALQAK
jgi:hypothetical protein